MNTKNLILIFVIVILFASSGILFYRNFSGQVGVATIPEVSADVVAIRQNISAIDSRIKAAMQRIDANGDLDKLVNSAQFQELVTDALRPIQVTESGRANPFVPVARNNGIGQ